MAKASGVDLDALQQKAADYQRRIADVLAMTTRALPAPAKQAAGASVAA